MAARYGNFRLRIGDSDKARRWGGEVQPLPTPPLETALVANLQADLLAMGFRLVGDGSGKGGDPKGVFGLWTAAAVREFQIYAKTPRAIRSKGGPLDFEVINKLPGEPKLGGQMYPAAAPVSGIVNADCELLIDIWRNNNWLCPIVICAYEKTRHVSAKPLVDVNVWTPHDLSKGGTILVAHDYSGRIEQLATQRDGPVIPAGRSLAAADIGFSMRIAKGAKNGARGGLRGEKSISWPEVEITPKLVYGPATMSATQASTFRVLRAVAETECYGRFDILNGYDGCAISAGTFHYTIMSFSPATKKSLKATIGGGELAAFLGLLTTTQEGALASKRWFDGLGLSTVDSWPDDMIQTNATYAAMPAWQGPATPTSKKAETDFDPLLPNRDHLELFRQYHWMYRFVMASRLEPAIWKAYWLYARTRIRDVLRSKWGPMPDAKWPDGITVGDVFKSEKAVAMVLKRHVHRPYWMIGKGHVGYWLKQAIKGIDTKTFDWTKPPASWPKDSERALIDGLLDRAEKDVGSDRVVGSFESIDASRGLATTNQLGESRAADKAFRLDDAGLDPATS